MFVHAFNEEIVTNNQKKLQPLLCNFKMTWTNGLNYMCLFYRLFSAFRFLIKRHAKLERMHLNDHRESVCCFPYILNGSAWMWIIPSKNGSVIKLSQRWWLYTTWWLLLLANMSNRNFRTLNAIQHWCRDVALVFILCAAFRPIVHRSQKAM